jgi:AcrR family transcriptional regulator
MILCEMVEKPRLRGRPRAYEPEEALDRAAELFWANGFSGTSLDDLSAAMGMVRPSIYNAFGDKEALFLQALERYRDTVASTPLAAMDGESAIGDALDAFFRQTVEYTTADSTHLGCLLGNVAPVTESPAVRKFLEKNIRLTERQVAKRLTDAIAAGELPSDYSAERGARRALNAMLSIGVRARFGAPRRELLKDASDATAWVLTA